MSKVTKQESLRIYGGRLKSKSVLAREEIFLSPYMALQNKGFSVIEGLSTAISAI